ncbi:hypothetical protein KC322_g22248, partial [Hortaea werneckii]
MSAAIMNAGMQAPHRKPVPGHAVAPAQQQQYPPSADQAYNRRVPSSSALPPNGAPAYSMSQAPQSYGYAHSARRTPSNATSSTSSTSTT